MTEVCPVETLTHLAKQVKLSLNETREYWETLSPDSRLLPMVNVEGLLSGLSRLSILSYPVLPQAMMHS